MTNDERAAYGESAINNGIADHNRDDGVIDRCDLVDTIANLMHYAKAKGFDFGGVVESATNHHFEAERDDREDDVSGLNLRPKNEASCGDCENEFATMQDAEDHVENSPYCRGPVRRNRYVTALALMACLTLTLAGCGRIQPKVEASAVARTTEASPTPEKAKARHLCAGKTKKGEGCRKPVKAEGDYCWMHQGQKKD